MLTRPVLLLTLLLAVGAVSRTALAFEVSTHQLMTSRAADKSVLFTDPTLLQDLGLPTYAFEDYYGSNWPVPLNVPGLMTHGAAMEDLLYSTRVFNHFFDPQYQGFTGRPLTVGIVLGSTSPDWALEDRGELSHAGTPQLYSYKNAQEAFFAGLTGSDAATRKNSFARMFQSLGHVVHHIQDMAQPQHTRNDQHVHPLPVIGGVPAWAFFEVYTQQTLDPRIDAVLSANPYPIPVLANPRQAWHTAGATAAQFFGMAEMTSQNYVSSGTQFRSYTASNGQSVIGPNPGFPLPNGTNRDGTPMRIQSESVAVLARSWGGAGVQRTGLVDYVVGNVVDSASGISYGGQRLAQTSVMTVFLEGVPLRERVFADDSAVFEDQYRILIPRAVAFSSALVNHFFRGRLNFRRNSGGSGWVIENLSRAGDDMNGAFVVYAESPTGVRTPVPGAAWTYIVPGGGTQVVTFAEPSPAPAKLVLAFQGRIGSTDSTPAVAGKVIEYTTAPIACGTSFSAAGSSEGLGRSVDLGSAAGTVAVEFDAYYIPDELRIYRGTSATGTPVVQTGGLVSGFYTFNFTTSSATSGTNKVFVKVIGNSDPGTWWTATVGCPGKKLDNSDRLRDRINVTLNFPAYGTNCPDESHTVFIDGVNRGTYRQSLSGSSGLVTLSVGQTHYVEVRTTTLNSPSVPGLCTYGGGMFYTDRTGPHTLPRRGWFAVN